MLSREYWAGPAAGPTAAYNPESKIMICPSLLMLEGSSWNASSFNVAQGIDDSVAEKDKHSTIKKSQIEKSVTDLGSIYSGVCASR
jgi:hypothetical protein